MLFFPFADFCEQNSRESRANCRQVLWNKISSATFFGRHKLDGLRHAPGYMNYWCDMHWQTGSLRPAPGYMNYWCYTHWQAGSLRPAPGYMNYWCDTHWQAGRLRPAPGYMNYWCYTDRPEVWRQRLVTWTIDVTLTGRKFEACAWLHELLMLHWQAGSLLLVTWTVDVTHTNRPKVWRLRLVTLTIEVTHTNRAEVWGLRLVTWTTDVTHTWALGLVTWTADKNVVLHKPAGSGSGHMNCG